jgi:uncharacterized membrane protein
VFGVNKMARVSDESKMFAFLAYLLSILGFLIIVIAKKDDEFAIYHAKQSLILFVIYMIGWIIFIFIPFIGWFILLPIWWLLFLALTIIGIVNAFSGKKKPLPIIGSWGEKIRM